MKRDELLARFRIAGYHLDMAKFVRLLVENRISREAAQAAYNEGKKQKSDGTKCTCYWCEKEYKKVSNE